MYASSYSTSIKAGAELIQTLSSSLYKNAYYVLDELISNSYDADATRVEIDISQDKLSIRDNGVGMDREGLENYLWLGYSEKQKDRRTGKFSRHTIGKFGIGKLSMHVICNRCRIITRKNGIERSLVLDFERILSHKGLSDEQIQVQEFPTKDADGTTIELIGLKKTIDVKKAMRRIARNMPLSPEFQIILNGELLRPEDVIRGKEYAIDITLKLAGRVTGKLVHSDSPLGEFAGVYIKVYGRTVNADDPNIFDLARSISSPGTFLARLYCVLNADGLDDIVLATRNGFYEESPKFVEFKEAVLKKIREITRDIQTSQSREELDYEKKLLEDVVRHQVERMLEGAELPEDFLAHYSKRSDAKEVISTIKKIEEQKLERERKVSSKEKMEEKETPPRLIKIGNKRFKFELESMGKNAYECVLDASKAVFYINIDHPQYIYSRREGSLAHHFRRVIIFEIARSISGNSLSEFITQYENMMLQEITIEESNQASNPSI
ncbi:MAG: ATP-binding protein [Candidatus Bathyarchaeia archaeon]